MIEASSKLTGSYFRSLQHQRYWFFLKLPRHCLYRRLCQLVWRNARIASPVAMKTKRYALWQLYAGNISTIKIFCIHNDKLGSILTLIMNERH